MIASPLRSLMQKMFASSNASPANIGLAAAGLANGQSQSALDQIIREQAKLDDIVKAYGPLLDLQDQRAFVQVEVLGDEHARRYQSMILGLDFARREIQLDTLTPRNPLHPVLEGVCLRVSHKTQQGMLSFQGRLKELRRDPDGLVYVMELPQEVAYQSHELFPSLNMQALEKQIGGPRHVKLLAPNRAPWFGRIHEISCSGLQVAVGGNICQQLSRGVLLPSCEFDFSPTLRIRCKARVNSYRYSRRPFEHTKLNLSFDDMGFQQRIRLQNHITFLLQSQSDFPIPQSA